MKGRFLIMIIVYCNIYIMYYNNLLSNTLLYYCDNFHPWIYWHVRMIYYYIVAITLFPKSLLRMFV